MADLRISQLQPLLAADVDGGADQLPIADVSTTETKKITPVALVQAAVGSLPAGSIPGAKIVNDSITALQLGPDSVGASELANGAVDTAAIVDGSVTGAKIAADAITAANIAPDAIGASELANNAVDTAAIVDGAVTAAKIAADSITALQLAPNSVGASELADASVDTAALVNQAVTNDKIAAGVDGAKLLASTVTAAALAANSVASAAIQAGAVTGAKIAADTITAANIAADAVGASELADNAVDTAAIANGAVSYAKLQNVSATDRLLGRSSAGAGVVEEVPCTAAGRALIAGTDAGAQRVSLGLGTLATQSGTFSGTHSGASSGTNTGDQTITLTGAVTGTGTGTFATSLAANAVNTAAVADGAVTAAKIAGDTITAAQIAPNAITASELADGAVDTAAIADGAVTTPKLADGAVTGVKIAAGTIAGDRLAAGSVGTTELKDGGVTAVKMAGDLSGAAFAAQAPAVVLAGPPSGANAKPTFRGLVSTDLPLATGTDVGAVKPVVNGGLVVASGGLSLDNTVTPGTSPVVTYNAKGLVTGGRALASADMPIATKVAVGVVRIGSGLAVAADGEVKTALVAADVPALDATKINTGVFNPERIADRSISNKKLDNYSVSYIQEAPPTAVAADHYAGQLWYQESTAQLFMWNGNSWMQVGSLGRLGTENMRFSGTWNAATAQVLVVTSFGKAAGLAGGAALPPASDALTGVYLVTTTPGTYNTVPYDNGDWVLCLGATAGWVRVDTLSSAGSSTISLKDLLDVNAPTPGMGDALIFDAASNRWVNRPTSAAKAVLTPPFDGIRTSFALNVDAPSVNAVLLSLGGVVQNPGVDFTLTGARTVNFAAPPPKGLDYWVLIEGLPSSGGGGGGGAALPPGTAAEEYLKWNATLGSWQPASTLEGGTY